MSRASTENLRNFPWHAKASRGTLEGRKEVLAMPRAPRPGKTALYVELPTELVRLLKARAKSERRDRTALVLMALEQFLGVTEADYLPPDGEPAPSS
jgi:hypothetical protein